jgi:hypothetical protein
MTGAAPDQQMRPEILTESSGMLKLFLFHVRVRQLRRSQ